MPATRYKVFARGAPVGEGVTDAFYVHVQGVAKAALPGLPYVVANELVCGRLAAVLLLPIPPGFIIDHDGKPHYVSLDFNLAGQSLPPANAAALMSELPRIGAGIITFDAWIVNSDRHRKNLAYDAIKKQAQIFDHSHAFYGHDGSNLTDHENDVGFERPHCLADYLRSFDDVIEWCRLIRSIPEHYIRAIVAAGADVGLPSDRKDYCADFLLRRREHLAELFVRHRDQFPNVTLKLWDHSVTAPIRPRRQPPVLHGGGGRRALNRILARIAKLRGGDGGRNVS